MRVLVTGAAGFIGINLSKTLLEAGHLVIGIDNFYCSDEKKLATLRAYDEFVFMRHDIITELPAALLSRLPQPDAVCNLACPASPEKYLQDPVYTTKTSVLGTLNMLEYAARLNIPLLQASTSEVYGDPLEHPQQEEYWGHVHPVGVRACYDEGKRAAESLCFDFVRSRGAKVKVIRIFNTYGPHMAPDDGRVMSNFIVQALEDKPLTVYGDGSQTRSFCFVDDLVQGMIKFLELPCEKCKQNIPQPNPMMYGPVNLGNPHEVTIAELTTYIQKYIPGVMVEYRPLPHDDPRQRCPDITRAGTMLGWKPVVSLGDGIQKTIEWFKKTRG